MNSPHLSVVSGQYPVHRLSAISHQLSVLFVLRHSSLIPHPSSLVPACIALATCLFAAPALGQEIQPPQIVGVRAGFAGQSKVGLWSPIEITLQGGSKQLTGMVSVTVPDGDGIPSRVFTSPNKPCQVLPGRQTNVLMYVRFGRVYTDLNVQFIVDGRVAAEKTLDSSLGVDKDHFLEPLEAQPLIVAVGAAPLGIEDSPRIRETALEFRPVVARLDGVDQLPTHWYGYEGVDTLVLTTSQPETYRKLTPDSARLDALDQWIRIGGRMVLCVGAQGDEVLAKDSALARFAPGRLERMETIRQTGALEVYSGGSTPVPSASGNKPGLRAPKLIDVQGVIEARHGDLPLVVRTPRGLGQVVFVAADLDQPPFSKWADRHLLLAKLLDMPAGGSEEAPRTTQLSYFGYTDLAGQLRSALDRFTGVRMIPFSLVAILIIVYILLIGPGDYFFLRLLVRRMQWTWLTFPIIVLAVSAAAYALAYYLKGDQLRVNQVDLVDVDAATGFLRGTTWLNIFSPRMESFDLSLQAQLPDGKAAENAQSWLAWLGLHGRALGAMNPRGANPTLWPEHYAFAPDLSEMLGVPIQVWSTKSFTGRWSASNAAVLRADLADEDQTLVGSMTNPYEYPLQNCLLVYDRWAYEVGAIGPGQTVALDQNTKRSELKTLLTGKRTIFGEKMSQEITPYDQANTDPPYIVRRMMFYKAIDGRNYTGMNNGYQTFVDLSDLLKAGRAILAADGPNLAQDKFQGARLMRSGKPLTGPMDKHTTLYRFILPVKKQ
jgi:hypothetical protein